MGNSNFGIDEDEEAAEWNLESAANAMTESRPRGMRSTGSSSVSFPTVNSSGICKRMQFACKVANYEARESVADLSRSS